MVEINNNEASGKMYKRPEISTRCLFYEEEVWSGYQKFPTTSEDVLQDMVRHLFYASNET